MVLRGPSAISFVAVSLGRLVGLLASNVLVALADGGKYARTYLRNASLVLSLSETFGMYWNSLR